VPASDELLRAYDVLTEVAVWTKSSQAHLPDEMARLFDQAKQFYREAHKAFSAGNQQRAAEYALASSDAGGGLLYFLHASTPPLTDLPKPPQSAQEGGATGTASRPAPPAPPGAGAATPPASGRYGNLPSSPTDTQAPRPNPAGAGAAAGTAPPMPDRNPWQPALFALQDARSRIRAATENASKGAGQEFLAASRNVYEQGRKAYQEQHYFKAFELAMAAVAWTRVPEHLDQANIVTGAGRGPARIPAPPPGFDDRGAPVRPPRS
jgi:hypothetical protein